MYFACKKKPIFWVRSLPTGKGDFSQNNDILLRMRKHIMEMSKQLSAYEQSHHLLGQYFLSFVAFDWFIV